MNLQKKKELLHAYIIKNESSKKKTFYCLHILLKMNLQKNNILLHAYIIKN